MKQEKFHRVMEMLTTLQAGKNYKPDELMGLFDVSRRTVFRDLEELQRLGVPYHYDRKTCCYALDPEYFLPPVDFNLQEALSLLLVVHKAGNQMQVPFGRSALVAAMKLENNLPPGIRKYCADTLSHITTKGAAKAMMPHLDETFACLQKAVVDKQKVDIRYQSLFDGDCIETTVCPYHLLYNNRAWYVLGFSRLHKSVRTFKLNRIKEFKALDKRFIDGDDFDINDYLGRAWSMIPEGRIYHIRLRFAPRVASNVAEVRWHSTQGVRFNKDGSADIEFRVDGLGEIYWWVLGYGDQVQVLAPKVLKEKIADAARNMLKLHLGK